MDRLNDRAAYFRFLIEMLAEAGLQLEADGDYPHPVRYGEHLAEIRHALDIAAVAARFILADLKSDPEADQAALAQASETILH